MQLTQQPTKQLERRRRRSSHTVNQILANERLSARALAPAKVNADELSGAHASLCSARALLRQQHRRLAVNLSDDQVACVCVCARRTRADILDNNNNNNNITLMAKLRLQLAKKQARARALDCA